MPGKSPTELLGVDGPRGTRERLLYAALDLFYTDGFHAVGLDRILAEVGVTKTTFYNHFESKDDLAVCAIAKRDLWEREVFRREVETRCPEDPRGQLMAMFDVLHDWFTLPDFRGCLYINACSEFPSQHDPVHQAAREHYVALAEYIRDLAQRSGVDAVDALADEWVLLIQGAFTVRQVLGDNLAARNAQRIASARLEVYLDATNA